MTGKSVVCRSPPSVLGDIRLSGVQALHAHLRVFRRVSSAPARSSYHRVMCRSGIVSVPDLALGRARICMGRASSVTGTVSHPHTTTYLCNSTYIRIAMASVHRQKSTTSTYGNSSALDHSFPMNRMQDIVNESSRTSVNFHTNLIDVYSASSLTYFINRAPNL